MLNNQYVFDLDEPVYIDLFAGGGGMSQAIEDATGVPVFAAANHSRVALWLHEVNHPQTRHHCAGVQELHPMVVSEGRPIRGVHLSPECIDHSQAKGGQPRSKKSRSLSWITLRWAGAPNAPELLTIENVVEMKKWSPLIAKRCKTTGRVVKLDGSVAAPGERVPVRQQHLIPDPKRIGETYRRFLQLLRSHNYRVEDGELVAADWGAGTTRRRLFIVAKKPWAGPIVWPAPTHHQFPKRGQKGWTPASDGIDFSLPCHSIFMPTAQAKKLRINRPLKDKTLTRLALGAVRYVLESADPFIVPATHADTSHRMRSVREPLPTITAANRGELMLVQPTLTPVRRITSAFIAQQNNHRGVEPNVGRDIRRPLSSITTTGSQQQLVLAHLVHLRNNCDARPLTEPLRVISAGGEHHGLVTTTCEPQHSLSKQDQDDAVRVAKFLLRYAGTEALRARLTKPVSRLTRADWIALVTVTVNGQKYVITDLAIRMLSPRDLARCQGLPPDYILDRGPNGEKISRTDQVRMIGNSVSPPPGRALIAANLPPQRVTRLAA